VRRIATTRLRERDWQTVLLPSRVERLANGLVVVAHREPKSPLVAVYVAYRAGSRDEPASKAGLAHLCEHLMFCGTRGAPGSYFAPMEQAGAAWMNAFVKEDFSAYFATLPVEQFGFALRMEADRMANLADSLDEERVDRQREVVRNELRQRASEAYGSAARLIAELAHPAGHPYAHPADGLLEELDNITTADARGWIATRHIAADAAVIVAGDIEPDEAIANVRYYFEGLASVASTARDNAHLVLSRKRQQVRVEHSISQARVYALWSAPSVGSPDYPALELACEILAGSRNSRLYRRIMEKAPLGLEVGVELRPRELGSLVLLYATARPSIEADQLEEAIRLEVERLCVEGLSKNELDAARLRLFSRLVRDLEHVGGPRSKSDALGLALMAAGDALHHDWRIAQLSRTDDVAVHAVVEKWLDDTAVILEIHPRLL
jgi:zinc protease